MVTEGINTRFANKKPKRSLQADTKSEEHIRYIHKLLSKVHQIGHVGAEEGRPIVHTKDTGC